jgi:2-hydroxychromene-2-carboxylate isomerase
MQATNNKPPGIIPSKGIYIAKDLELWSRHYGIPFSLNSIFPQNTLTALRLAIACQREDNFQLIHQAFFKAMFVDNLDLNNTDILRDILNQQQLNSDELIIKASESSIKDELKRNTNEAVARGAFGAPTFFIDGEMFFGNDRLDFIRTKLL